MFCTIFNWHNLVVLKLTITWSYLHKILRIEDRAKHYSKNECTLIFIFFYLQISNWFQSWVKLELVCAENTSMFQAEISFWVWKFCLYQRKSWNWPQSSWFFEEICSCKDFQGVALSSYLTEQTENYCCFDFTSADQIWAGAAAGHHRRLATGWSRQI